MVFPIITFNDAAAPGIMVVGIKDPGRIDLMYQLLKIQIVLRK
jgi:hypothetical protein